MRWAQGLPGEPDQFKSITRKIAVIKCKNSVLSHIHLFLTGQCWPPTCLRRVRYQTHVPSVFCDVRRGVFRRCLLIILPGIPFWGEWCWRSPVWNRFSSLLWNANPPFIGFPVDPRPWMVLSVHGGQSKKEVYNDFIWKYKCYVVSCPRISL